MEDDELTYPFPRDFQWDFQYERKTQAALDYEFTPLFPWIFGRSWSQRVYMKCLPPCLKLKLHSFLL